MSALLLTPHYCVLYLSVCFALALWASWMWLCGDWYAIVSLVICLTILLSRLCLNVLLSREKWYKRLLLMVTRRPCLLRSLLGTLSTLLSMSLPFEDALADVDGGTWNLLLWQHGLVTTSIWCTCVQIFQVKAEQRYSRAMVGLLSMKTELVWHIEPPRNRR